MIDPEAGGKGDAAELSKATSGAPSSSSALQPQPRPPPKNKTEAKNGKPLPWFANARRRNVWSVKVTSFF